MPLTAAMFPKLVRMHKCYPKKMHILQRLKELSAMEPEKYILNPELTRFLTQQAVRSASGIINVSVSMPPDKFSCKYNCYFCPNEPGMPRSYLSNEPVFLRAKELDFNTFAQVHNRLDALYAQGHSIDKIEFRVLGGTFSCYGHDIADEYIHDLYYAANTWAPTPSLLNAQSTLRPRLSLKEEQDMNEYAQVHVVGLGVETRPDEITLSEIERFRRYGVTRVELGVQHTDDKLLRRMNRGHGINRSRQAIRLLKNYGFKIEAHIMPDMPGATPEGDMECYKTMFSDPDLLPDYLKDYVCLDVSYTEISKWKAMNKWQPYSEKDINLLMDVLVYRQEITPLWVRVNRIQRDFVPATETDCGFTSDTIKTNLSQLAHIEAEKRGVYCKCIRCCELKDKSYNANDVEYYTCEVFKEEWFIWAGTHSAPNAPNTQTNRHVMLGFIRLRFPTSSVSVFPALQNAALIRELHVYGQVKSVSGASGASGAGGAQHNGIGTKLLNMAEEKARNNGFYKMAIISGVGVRGYYRKKGYELRDTYMVKELIDKKNEFSYVKIFLLVFIFMFYLL